MRIPFGISDPYVRRARLQPALLTTLPLALAFLAYFPNGLVGWGVLWTMLVVCGGTALLAQVARDRGKRKEPELFRMWGGKPTTRLLRHRGTSNGVVLQRRHEILHQFMPNVRVPTAAEEQQAPEQADQVYEACTAFLIEKTRDRERFPLVFEENCNYGFRRNLWGMKPVGIMTASLGSIAIAVLLLFDFRRAILPSPIGFVCAGISLLLLLGWVGWFTPRWVKIAADAYAERLLASCEVL